MSSSDLKYIRRCVELAQRGAGYVSPNPKVGAVVVVNGEIISEGWHQKYGGRHAREPALVNTLPPPPRGARPPVRPGPRRFSGETSPRPPPIKR